MQRGLKWEQGAEPPDRPSLQPLDDWRKWWTDDGELACVEWIDCKEERSDQDLVDEMSSRDCLSKRAVCV